MNGVIHKLFQTFSLRLFLNIVLWITVSVQLYYSNVPEHHVREITLYKSVSLLSLIIFTYTNNLFLVPRYLATRRFQVYIPLALFLTVSYALLYSIFVLWVKHHTPDIKVYEIVIFSVPFKPEWALAAVRAAAIGYSITFGLWLFILTMAWYMHDHAQQRRAMLLAQQKQTETELSFLRAQINPHFLFNTLNNLYALALRKSDRSPDAILKLSSILRYLLYDANITTISFEKEKEIMEAYIDIESLRLDRSTRLDIHITADEPCQVPPLLWLPILENIFKHGTRTISEDNPVEFRFEIRNKKMVIYSKNKEKMLARTAEKEGGIGLTNLQKRLALLYPGRHIISILQQDGYHISEVKIDLAS